MKSLVLLPILLAPTTAIAQDGAIDLGLAGGIAIMDPLEVLGTSPTISPRVGYWFSESMLLEADLGFGFGDTSVGTPDPFPFLSLTPRVNMVGRVWADRPINVLFVAGIGAWYKKVDDGGVLALPQGEGSDIDFLGNAGPGLMVPLGDSLALRTDLRWMLSLGAENWENHGDAFMSWEWTAGVNLMIGGQRDADKDGIADDLEARPECIDLPEDMDGWQDEDGCPDTDNDEDGIVDADDACANEAEDIDEWQDEDGCPDLDNDEDGVLDVDDECPMRTGHETAKGCPDEDGDGIVSDVDECPNEAGPIESFGCPDGDGDLVPDYRDECPEEKAQDDINPLRSNGCPALVYYTADKLVIMDKIQFATGRAVIRKASDELIENIATALKRAPDVTKVEVGGHTDSTGDDAKNLKLSEERAAAVVERLVSLEVEAGRLVAKGYGETKPVGDNETDEGRTANRRVEFVILEQKENLMRRKIEKTDDGEGTEEGKKTAPREAPADDAKEAPKKEGEKTAPREAPAKEDGAQEAKTTDAPKEAVKTAPREVKPAVEEAKEEAAKEAAKTAPREAPKAEEVKEAAAEEASKEAAKTAPREAPKAEEGGDKPE